MAAEIATFHIAIGGITNISSKKVRRVRVKNATNSLLRGATNSLIIDAFLLSVVGSLVHYPLFISSNIE